MIVEDVVGALESIAPSQYAANWDNVGLVVGSRRWRADSILLTIDLTEAVMREAADVRAQMIVSYHPPIFEPLKSLTDATSKQRIVLEAVENRIAIYSPHTALDAAPGGVNDWLAACLGQGDVRALQSREDLPESEQCKIITFCPADAVDQIRNGLAAVGAGRIGRYQLCSFEIPGKGTFLGGEDTNPKVGRRGSLQRVDEVRLEMVCPKPALGLAMIALREFHPYEEPPIEIHPLLPRPQRSIGQGRRATLDQPASLRTLLERIKGHLGVRQLQVAIGDRAPGKYARIGLCAGAGGSLLDAAIDQGCEMFLTGEMRHHDVLAAQSRGCTVVLAGHTNTERGYLKVLRKKVIDVLPDLKISLSKRDADPLRVM
jgi:dinuclear metal center YbgI/SA1388 family protein